MITDACKLAWKLVTHRPLTLFFATISIAFAVILVFIQYGFYHAIADSQANIAHYLNADLVAIDINRTTLNKWDEFEPHWLAQMAVVDGVKEVIPLYKGSMQWLNKDTKQTKRIIVLAYQAGSHALRLQPDKNADNLLKTRGNFLFDNKARRIYGKIVEGENYQLDGQYYRLAKKVKIGVNLVNDGLLILSEGDWRSRHSNAKPIMALIRGNHNAMPALKKLTRGYLQIFTPEQLFQREIDYTTQKAPIGLIFGIGMLTCLFIAAMLAYQIIQQEIENNQQAFATLSAMGFGRLMILSSIFFMSLIYIAAGFLLALPLVAVFYQLLAQKTAMIFFLSVQRVGFIALLMFALVFLISWMNRKVV